MKKFQNLREVKMLVCTSTVIGALFGCASTELGYQPSYKATKILPYETKSSFAYNVLKQIEVDKYISDSFDTQTFHADFSTLAKTYQLATSIYAGFDSLAKLAKDSKEAELPLKDYIIMAVDLRNEQSPRQAVAQAIMQNIKNKSPDVKFSATEEGYGYLRFTETSEACRRVNEFNSDILVRQNLLKPFEPTNTCHISLHIHFSYQANDKIFPESAGHTTVRVRSMGFRGIQDLTGPNDFIYRAPRKAEEKYGSIYSPAYIQKGDIAFLLYFPFLLDESGKNITRVKSPSEQAISRSELPKQTEVYPYYTWL